MKDLNFKQLTALTGYKYNMFGQTLEHIGRDEEHRKLIQKNKDRVVNFQNDEECEEWIKEIEVEVELGKQSLELTTSLYQNSKKHCVGSLIISILAIVMFKSYFALLFLLPTVFFAIRIVNFIKAYRIQRGFLQMGTWILRENTKKTYNPTSNIDFNAPVIKV